MKGLQGGGNTPSGKDSSLWRERSANVCERVGLDLCEPKKEAYLGATTADRYSSFLDGPLSFRQQPDRVRATDQLRILRCCWREVAGAESDG